VNSSSPQFQRVVGLPGAILMGLGSIMGAGVFVSLGLGEQITGPSVLLPLALAAVVAPCNGLSSAQLSANHPVSQRNLRIRATAYSDACVLPDGRVAVLFEKDGKSKLGFMIVSAPPATPPKK